VLILETFWLIMESHSKSNNCLKKYSNAAENIILCHIIILPSQVDMFIILIGVIDQQQACAEYSC